MGTKYTSQSATGYNASPPPDDGTTVAANKATWAMILTKLTDVLKNYVDSINSALVTAFDVGGASVAGTYATVAGDNGRILECSGTFTVSLMDGSTAGAGYAVTLKNIGTGVVTIALVTNTNKLDLVTNGTVTLTAQQSRTYKLGADGITYELVADANIGTLIGGIVDYAGAISTVPGGFLAVDGSSLDRTAYAALFAVLGTSWGNVDGTHFNLPPPARFALAAGTATAVETQTNVAASSNQLPVASNNTKWITGMTVVSTSVSGFTGFTNSTYYIVRVDSTHIKLASSLANAQNGTTITITGTGTFTITWTGTARSLGEYGGEQSHAMNSAELLAHNHAGSFTDHTNIGAAVGTAATLARGDSSTTLNDIPVTVNSDGGNAAMNIMPPYAVYNKIIRAL